MTSGIDSWQTMSAKTELSHGWRMKWVSPDLPLYQTDEKENPAVVDCRTLSPDFCTILRIAFPAHVFTLFLKKN